MNAAPPNAALDEAIVERAIAWYVSLASGVAADDQRAEFEQWRAARPEHALAWQRLQAIGGRLHGTAAVVEPALTRATIARLSTSAPSRRRAFKSLAWIGAGGAALYLAQRQWPSREQWAGAWADERTAVGQRRELTLSDGTRLTLNTGSAIDVRFDARVRQLMLWRGEMLVQTARDGSGRDFVVSTTEGTLTPLGTRFVVRRDERDAAARSGPLTRVAVTGGAVAVRGESGDGASVIVRAGQQAAFTRERIGAVEPLDDSALAWIDGMLTAERMRLGDFIAELRRYRPGRLHCAPEVAGLRITGAWPLAGDDPTERILASIERQLPVRVERFTRYWTTVVAR